MASVLREVAKGKGTIKEVTDNYMWFCSEWRSILIKTRPFKLPIYPSQLLFPTVNHEFIL